jgi:hypothetical protein
MPKSNSFEEMRAPAATGQLSPDEYQQMAKHAENCPSCQAARQEFLQFLQKLPADEGDRGNSALLHHIEKGGLRQRFLERTRAEGINFSEDVQNRHDNWGWEFPLLVAVSRWAAVGAILAMIIVMIGYFGVQKGKKHSLDAVPQSPPERALNLQNRTSNGLEAKFSELQTRSAASQKAIIELQGENALLLTRIGTLEKDLVTSQAEKRGLQQSLAHLSDVNSQLASQNDHDAQLQTRTEAEIEEMRARRTRMEADIAAQRAEVDTLSQQLKLKTAAVDRENELLAAGRDITDLMGARNLHIIDVRDANGIGKNNKAFGRIFYTEGKSLIFYAFDLDERKLANANYSLAVWGERLGEPTSIRSLGILYSDDKYQKRWALKVDDPQQVAEIDSVFVTLESHEGSNKPRGQKILFAFLGGKANHP